MNAALAIAVAATLIVAGVGPFLAVHIGGKAFDPDEPVEPLTCTDDTISIPRVRAEIDPRMY